MSHGGVFHEEFEDPDDESWAAAGKGRRWGLIGFVGVSVLALAVGLGAVVMLLSGGGGDPKRTSDAGALPTVSATSAIPPATVAETTAPAPAATSASPTPTASKTAKPRSSPSKNPAAASQPAPPPPATRTTAPGCTPKTSGPPATRPDVRAALKVAAGRTYWRSVPTIQIPERLLQAVAMTESTWQSNVIACDGGIGLMQVMPDTVTQINNRFGTTWNVNTLDGNAALGGNYLAWSTKYLGDLYFGGSYDLANPALLESVIAAYNYGAGAIDPTKGEAGIPNRAYVNRVKGYMASCPCDSW